jgi:hypothetical protein
VPAFDLAVIQISNIDDQHLQSTNYGSYKTFDDVQVKTIFNIIDTGSPDAVGAPQLPSTQPFCHEQCYARIGRSDCCNHGVQQMDERSPVGCFIAFVHRVALPLVSLF